MDDRKQYVKVRKLASSKWSYFSKSDVVRNISEGVHEQALASWILGFWCRASKKWNQYEKRAIRDKPVKQFALHIDGQIYSFPIDLDGAIALDFAHKIHDHICQCIKYVGWT